MIQKSWNSLEQFEYFLSRKREIHLSDAKLLCVLKSLILESKLSFVSNHVMPRKSKESN